jgi:gliding motility-associated-like protein
LKRKDIFLFLLIIFLSSISKVYSQTPISGIINEYTAVDSIYPTKDTIEVRNPSLFSANDTVMMYQVKGAAVRTDTTESNRYLFGTFASINSANNAGNYEIILIEKVDGNKVIFKVSLNNNYTANDLVQLITVPTYVRASVDAELTCKSWEDSTGGVLVLMVSDTLFLNANIDVTGKGFRGAEPFESNGQCASTDFSLYESYYLGDDADTLGSGFKGEGVAKYDPKFAKGVGRWANGGGAGSGRFAGGGGGGNAGNGGIGGAEDTTVCSLTSWPIGDWKGLGGNDGYGIDGIFGTINDSTIFLGGGGGSGTYIIGFTASNGENGGGAVIIVATNVKSNGYKILADGGSVSDVTIEPLNVTNVVSASAGGGGGGGVVVFDADSVVGKISISAQGGQGGFVETLGTSGPGGGGGGGVIFWQNYKPDSVSTTLSGGEKGYVRNGFPGSESGYNASDGSFGSTKNNVRTPLTGFLYNNIIDNQDVCEGYSTRLLEGSTLRGGGGPGSYIYQWQDSPDGLVWSNISGATDSIYQASSLIDTTYYRRVAQSGSIIDYGNNIKVNLHSSIVNNTIFGDDLIECIDNLGDTITGTVVSEGGDTQNYSYVWQYKLDSEDWSDFSSAETNDTLMFPGLISDTTYVRRIVISGACRDTVPAIEIIALPKIDSNIISAVDEICYNDDPDAIIGKKPSFGDGSYTYQWQKKTNSTVWEDISGANQKDYDPSNLIDTTYYKRIVFSDDCFNESDEDTIIVLSLIEYNVILTSTPTRTCYDTQKQIDASVPIGGRGVYDYQWQESSDGSSWTDVTADAINQNYLSYNLLNSTYFRRYVKSGACDNTSANIYVLNDPLPIGALTSFVDTSCSGEEIILDFNITTGSPTYTLVYSDNENNYTETGLVENLNQITVNPITDQTNHELNYSFVSVEDQNGCFATDINGLGQLTIFGNPQANPGISKEHCLLSYQLDATPTLGSGMWKAISEAGTTDFNNDHVNPNANITVDQAGPYIYEWKETNWKCVDSANVELRFYEQLQDVKIVEDDGVEDGEVTLFYIDEYNLVGEFTDLDMADTVVSNWFRISDNDGDILYDSETSTEIINLFDNKNSGIVVTWTVQKGVCTEIIDTLTLKLDEIFTPTGFTPNGDGINDNLKFLGLENAQSSELIIYNRWGTEVFRTKNLSNELGWDGRKNDGNELPEDTYYYVLNVVSKNNSNDNYKGFIVLKRF